MKKFFFWCEVRTKNGESVFGLLDVVTDSEASARIALNDKMAFDLPGLDLVKAEFVFARCESLTEFIRKAA